MGLGFVRWLTNGLTADTTNCAFLKSFFCSASLSPLKFWSECIFPSARWLVLLESIAISSFIHHYLCRFLSLTFLCWFIYYRKLKFSEHLNTGVTCGRELVYYSCSSWFGSANGYLLINNLNKSPIYCPSSGRCFTISFLPVSHHFFSSEFASTFPFLVTFSSSSIQAGSHTYSVSDLRFRALFRACLIPWTAELRNILPPPVFPITCFTWVFQTKVKN